MMVAFGVGFLVGAGATFAGCLAFLAIDAILRELSQFEEAV